ncbi:MAG: hypothetical protein ATN36_04190 [Epulopiscium sp. Nele67-Bin005]|nr:MAG: hypothetical protein ATN36_04190 [Epulopiscium sp. Nele67-Bin005]
MTQETTKQYAKIIAGSASVAIGLHYFWAPAQLAGGGVSGLAIVLNAVFPALPISFAVFLLDSFMFTIGFLVLGKSFGIKSITSSFSIVIVMRILEVFSPNMMPLSDDTLILLIFGGLFMAFGQGVIFAQGASSGGTDIVAKIISKYTHLNIGTSLIFADMAVVLFATQVFGISKGLYAALGVLLTSVLIDYFISGFSVERYMMIIPSSPIYGEGISKYILENLERGATTYEAKGAFSQDKKSVITTIVDRREFIKVKQFIQSYDKDAFVNVQNLHEVLGNGFHKGEA